MAMSRAARGPARARALAGLGSLIGFDAALLVRAAHGAAPLQVAGLGYDPGSAHALTHDFASLYREGFTRRLSTADGLPLSISHGPLGVAQRFLGTAIYREHLGPSGFLDGISMELTHGERRIGLAHFSSRVPDRFTHEARRRAEAVSGLLAVMIDEAEAPALPSGWTELGETRAGVLMQAEAPGSAHPLSRDPRFARHLRCMPRYADATVEHLWLGERRWRVRLEPVGRAGVSVQVREASGEDLLLSDQEIRVLSLLATGAEDARIAGALTLSVRTVHSHVAAVRRKLGAANRVEAAVIAVTRGIIEPDPERCPIGVLHPARG